MVIRSMILLKATLTYLLTLSAAGFSRKLSKLQLRTSQSALLRASQNFISALAFKF